MEIKIMKRFILFSFMTMFALSSVAYADEGYTAICVEGQKLEDADLEASTDYIQCGDDESGYKYYKCTEKGQLIVSDGKVCKYVWVTADQVIHVDDEENEYYVCNTSWGVVGYNEGVCDEIDGEPCYEYSINGKKFYIKGPSSDYNGWQMYPELGQGVESDVACEEAVQLDEDASDDVVISPVNTSTQNVFCYPDDYNSHVTVDKKYEYIICNEENAYKCDEASRFIYLPKGHRCVEGDNTSIKSDSDVYAKCDGSNWIIFDSIDDSIKCVHTKEDSCYEYLIGADTYYVNNKGMYKLLDGRTYKKCSEEKTQEVVAADTGKLSATAGNVTATVADGETPTTEEVLAHKDYENILKELKGYKLLDRSVWKTEDGKFNTARLMVDVGSGAVLGTVGGVIANTVIRKNQISSGMEGYQCHINGQVVADYGDEFVVDIYK